MTDNPCTHHRHDSRGQAGAHHCSQATRLQALTRSPLTGHLPEADLLELSHRLKARAWGPGETVLRAGDAAEGSYIVMAGLAKIVHDTADGRSLTLDLAAPGDVLGPVHSGPGVLTDSVLALEPLCALYLPATELADLVQEHPALAVQILNLQQERLARVRHNEIAQATLPVTQRVADVLLHLNTKLGATRADGVRVLTADVSRADIAGMAGTTVESASRVMAAWKKQGLIDSGRRWVALLDVAALARVAEN
ncbi:MULTISPECIES: Crp/Fnr family transcriptional regulator [Rothia]|uniref:Crp/Fnr family transcriptional regulator n=1 Tax=Rothia nasimurium TaxID=85336 RepID=A0A1Y1RSA1_9MICC|nr:MULTISPECIES: Crp/Fnr family transcriptional regulator [Rothia]ORC24978.1 hypothetical protein A7979_09095 [Rothia nasimurium]